MKLLYIKKYNININMSDKLSSVAMDITIDENNRIRVLPSDKFAASEKLKGESQKFVESN